MAGASDPPYDTKSKHNRFDLVFIRSKTGFFD